MNSAIVQLIERLADGDLNPIEPESFEKDERTAAAGLEKLRRLLLSERESYEEELRLCRDRYASILEETPVGICITNADGLYEYVNEAYLKIYGYRRDELLGAHFTMVVPPKNRRLLTQLHDEFLGRKYELSGEWEVARKDGSLITILANAAYLLDKDNNAKKVTFVLDISKRKEAENKLFETVENLKEEISEREKLEAAREQVERMVRHDLKNPLNGVLGVSQLLMQECESESRRDLLKMLYDSGMQMLTMIESFFDYLRMEEGTYELEPQRFEVCSYLNHICTEMRQGFQTEKIELICRLNGRSVYEMGERECYVSAEPVHLKTVLENLVRNAFEASETGDTIRFDAYCNGSFRVEIHNPAPVPEEVRPRFFDRYVTHGKERGTGIGTYIAKLVTEYHGGTIGFTTSEESGTRVFLEIPDRS